MRTLFDKFKKWFKGAPATQKSWWTPISNGAGTSYDFFGGQAEPTKLDLVRAYEDIVYSTVSLIAQNIAHVPIRLYVKTATGQRQPKCATAPVRRKNRERVQSKSYGSDVKEVIEHPLLDLLNNPSHCHNIREFLELTAIYLDTTGNAYVLMQFNSVGVPESLYLLPSQNMTPERDDNNFISSWKFNQGTTQKTFSVKEVIHLKHVSPADPYGEGTSPLRGIWGRREISSKELSYLDNYLSNQGRYDAVLSIKDSVSPVEAERIDKEYRHRVQGSGAGGLLVLDGTMNLQPLSWGAKDLAELQLYQTLKTSIMNAFHVPPDLFELGTSSNRSTREAALYAFAAQCLEPRLCSIVQKLNDRLVPYFDSRLFFEADPCVPDDKEYDLQVEQLLLTQQVITRDEARIRHGFVSEDWAREPLLPSGVQPATLQDEEPTQPEQQPPPVDRTAQAQAILALQQAVYAGQVPREGALAQLVILYGFGQIDAENLIPDVAPVSTVQEPPAGKGAEAGIAIPDFRQQGDYDCGAAACHSVAAYYDVGERTEEDFIAALGTSEQGTTPEHIGAYLTSLGLSVSAQEGMQLTDLADAVDSGCPVIVLVQADGEGHYQVVKSVGEEAVIVQDPSKGPLSIGLPEFSSNWHDEGFDHYGIRVCPGAAGKMRRKSKRTLRQASPLPLVRAIAGVFSRLGKSVAENVGTHGKAVSITDWFDLEVWTQAMFNETRPVLAALYNHAAKETVATLDVNSSLFNTVQPKLREGVDQSCMVFCRETLATTSKDVGDAVEAVRKEISEGLEEGDVKNAMMKRVQSVFEDASVNRAFRIGVTEASRGQHNAMIITAQESGVVKGKKWLRSDDSCDLCKELSGMVVGLDESFTTVGTGPYSVISSPPAHPACRCNLLLET